MKMKELIDAIKQDEEFKKIPKKKIALMAKKIFSEVRQEIEKAEKVVRIPELGRFRVRNVEKEIDGVKKNQQRILFNPSNKKEK